MAGNLLELVSIPPQLLLAPRHYNRRSESSSLEEAFDLQGLATEYGRRGSQIQVAVAGLESSHDLDSAAGPSSIRRNSSFKPKHDYDGIGLSLPQIIEIPLDRPTYPGTSIPSRVSNIVQSLEPYRFPPFPAPASVPMGNASLYMTSDICPLETEYSGPTKPQVKHRESSIYSMKTIFRQLSVVSAPSMPTRQRQFTLHNLLDNAKKVEKRIHRSIAFQKIFRYTVDGILLAALYFILVGFPLWKGLVYCMYIVLSKEFVLTGGCALFVGIAFM
jgi:hypothetical protein